MKRLLLLGGYPSEVFDLTILSIKTLVNHLQVELHKN